MIGWAGDDMSCLHLALYADAEIAGCVESLRSTLGARLRCVSHSTPEAEIVSADTAVRTIGLPALDLWDVLSSATKGNLCLYEDNQAMISVVRSGRSPTMRYLERTHGVSVVGCMRYSRLTISLWFMKSLARWQPTSTQKGTMMEENGNQSHLSLTL